MKAVRREEIVMHIKYGIKDTIQAVSMTAIVVVIVFLTVAFGSTNPKAVKAEETVKIGDTIPMLTTTTTLPPTTTTTIRKVTTTTVKKTYTTPTTVKQVAVQAPSGSCRDWIIQAGISDVDNAYWLVMKESGCNPNAYNSSSGACSLVQSLPCSKIGADWRNPIVALRWGNGYVMSRYGSWAAAVAHSKSYGWY